MREGDWEARLSACTLRKLYGLLAQVCLSGLQGGWFSFQGGPACWPKSHVETEATANRLMEAGSSQRCLEFWGSAHACSTTVGPQAPPTTTHPS